MCVHRSFSDSLLVLMKCMPCMGQSMQIHFNTKNRRWALIFNSQLHRSIITISKLPLHSPLFISLVWSKLRMFSCWDELNCTTAHFVLRMSFLWDTRSDSKPSFLPKSFSFLRFESFTRDWKFLLNCCSLPVFSPSLISVLLCSHKQHFFFWEKSKSRTIEQNELGKVKLEIEKFQSRKKN